MELTEMTNEIVEIRNKNNTNLPHGSGNQVRFENPKRGNGFRTHILWGKLQ
jgi:hypothetical protein